MFVQVLDTTQNLATNFLDFINILWWSKFWIVYITQHILPLHQIHYYMVFKIVIFLVFFIIFVLDYIFVLQISCYHKFCITFLLFLQCHLPIIKTFSFLCGVNSRHAGNLTFVNTSLSAFAQFTNNFDIKFIHLVAVFSRNYLHIEIVV